MRHMDFPGENVKISILVYDSKIQDTVQGHIAKVPRRTGVIGSFHGDDVPAWIL